MAGSVITSCVSDEDPTVAGTPSISTVLPDEMFAKLAPVRVYVFPGTSVLLGAIAVMVGAFAAGASCTVMAAWAVALSTLARIRAVPAATGLTTPCALTRAINQYAKSNELLKEKDPQITGDDVREGLAAVISIKHSDPKFESQTKVKLLSPEVESIVGSATYEGLMFAFEQTPSIAKRRPWRPWAGWPDASRTTSTIC